MVILPIQMFFPQVPMVFLQIQNSFHVVRFESVRIYGCGYQLQGAGATKQEGGGQVKFYPYKKGGREILKGGQHKMF